jgi:hypothetical protein
MKVVNVSVLQITFKETISSFNSHEKFRKTYFSVWGKTAIRGEIFKLIPFHKILLFSFTK